MRQLHLQGSSKVPSEMNLNSSVTFIWKDILTLKEEAFLFTLFDAVEG